MESCRAHEHLLVHITAGLAGQMFCAQSHIMSMSITRLRSLMQFRMGSHDLPVERGSFVRLALAMHMRICTECDTQAVCRAALYF